MLKNFTVDDSGLDLKASAAVTASAAGSVIADLGDGFVEGNLIVDVSAMDIVGNDEIYDIILQLSPDAAFGTAGNIVEKVALSLGAKETKRSDCDKDDAVGRYVIPFNNLFNGTIYRYARIYTVEAGATSSITYYARLAKK
jgi:hypothetical protein